MNTSIIARKSIENRSRKAMSNSQVGTYKFEAFPFHLDVRGKLSMGVLGKHLLNCADAYAADRGFDVVEQGGEPGIAVKVIVPGLAQKEVPGESTVINQQIPADACDDGSHQQYGYQDLKEFFHILAPF